MKQDRLCVVLGLDSQTGLSILRCLGREGIRVLGFDRQAFPMGRSSRYCDYFIRYKTFDHLLSLLLELARMLDRKLPIMVSSDSLAIFLDDHRDELSGYFLFNWQRERNLKEIINKHLMCRLSQKAGIDTPRTWCTDEMPLEQIRQEIVFPSFIKPLFSKERMKGIIVRSMREFGDALGASLFRNGFIVQEFIAGPETNIVTVGTFSNMKGQVIVTSCSRKVRQLPRDVGIATYIQSFYDEEAIRQAELFVRYAGYYGIAEIEFKRSITDGRYKFIEINPRASGLNEFSMAQGVNLPHICYLDLMGMLNEQSINREKRMDISWISFLDDLHTFFRFYFLDDPKAIMGWIQDVAKADVDAVYSMQDWYPFGMAIIENMKKPFRRLKEVVF